MPSNPFKGLEQNPNGLIRSWLSVTPNDSADNVGTGNVAVGLYITGTGTVTWTDVDGIVTGPVTVPDNFTLTASISRVRATGTTATGIWALVSV